MKAKRSLSLSKKLLLMVVSTTTIFTTATSLLQIVIEYQNSKSEQLESLVVFESTAVVSIQNLLWTMNESALQEQLKTALTPRDFVEIVVENDSRTNKWESKKAGVFVRNTSKEFSISSPGDPSAVIGYATLHYTNDIIYAHMRSRALTIILSNFFKTLVVSAILLFLFRQHIVLRLTDLNSHLKSQNWKQPNTHLPVGARWPFAHCSDEMSEIEESVNEAVKIIAENSRNSEAQLVSSSRLAELGVLSAGIAHEINNPLTIILGNATLVQNIVTKPNPQLTLVANQAGQIVKAAERISNIVVGLRGFSRDGSGDSPLPHSIEAILLEIEPLLKVALANRQVRFELDTQNLKGNLHCRLSQVLQVILILVNNAADAIAGLSEKWIKLQMYRGHSDSLILTVTDSGLGIPSKVREKLFVPFFTTKEVGKGTGLGLSIAHGIVVGHGGTIEVNPNSRNTQFVVTLPGFAQKAA